MRFLARVALVFAAGCGARSSLDVGVHANDGGGSSDFEISVAPTSITVVQGGAPVPVSIHVQRGPGAPATVIVELSSVPTGIEMSKLVLPATTSDAVGMVSASLTAPQGAVSGAVVTGTSGAVTKTVPLGIYVRGCPGCLDTTFTATGYASADAVYAPGIAVDPSGSIYLAGEDMSSHAGAIVKLTSAGMRDATFGIMGVVEIHDGSNEVKLHAVDVDPTGAPVVCGDSQASQAKAALLVAKATTQGVLDPSFGDAGVTLPNVGSPAACAAIRVEQTGRLRVGAAVDGHGAFVLGVDAAGTLDATFGDGGAAFLPFGDFAAAPALDRIDGGFVAGGIDGKTPTSNGALVARIDATGALVPGFGDGGVAALPCLAARDLRAVSEVVVACDDVGEVTYDGALEPSFGDGGVARPSMSGVGRIGVVRLVAQDEGRIVLLGSAAIAKGTVIARLNATGTPDLTFGSSGVTPLADDDPAIVTDVPLGIALYPDARVVVTFTGVSSPAGKWVAYVARVWL